MWPLLTQQSPVELLDAKVTVLLACPDQPTNPLWNASSTNDGIQRAVAWCHTFIISNCRHPDLKSKSSTLKLEESRLLLLRLTQAESFLDTIKLLKKDKTLPSSHSLASLDPFLDEYELLHVGGRLQKSDLPFKSSHPIIIRTKSPFSRLLVYHVHQQANHAGPSTMLAILADIFYAPGIKCLCKSISRGCIACQKAFA